jgi:hypothetical protein
MVHYCRSSYRPNIFGTFGLAQSSCITTIYDLMLEVDVVWLLCFCASGQSFSCLTWTTSDLRRLIRAAHCLTLLCYACTWIFVLGSFSIIYPRRYLSTLSAVRPKEHGIEEIYSIKLFILLFRS